MNSIWIRILPLLLIGTMMVSWAGCASRDVSLEEMKKRRERVTYYDRNGDGKVDLEGHRYVGMADANWQLRDDNFDGRYEQKVVMGYAILHSTVDIPVPTGVRVKRVR